MSLDLVGVYVPSVSISGNRWGGGVSFIPGRFNPGTRWLSGWASSRENLEALRPTTELEPIFSGCSARNRFVIFTELHSLFSFHVSYVNHMVPIHNKTIPVTGSGGP
jgi:hypothetical protein